MSFFNDDLFNNMENWRRRWMGDEPKKPDLPAYQSGPYLATGPTLAHWYEQGIRHAISFAYEYKRGDLTLYLRDHVALGLTKVPSQLSARPDGTIHWGSLDVVIIPDECLTHEYHILIGANASKWAMAVSAVSGGYLLTELPNGLPDKDGDDEYTCF